LLNFHSTLGSMVHTMITITVTPSVKKMQKLTDELAQKECHLAI